LEGGSLSFKSAAEDIIKEQLMKQIEKFAKDKLEGKVPADVLDPVLKELQKELDNITLFS
jgi:Glu-tRNA(Gln) amidotransferase subunit E-like FAD-binding protein